MEPLFTPEEAGRTLEDIIKRTRALGSERSSENTGRQTASSTATSRKICPYNECDGSGFLYYQKDGGGRTAGNCRCVLHEIVKNRLKFSNIPPEFENLTIKSFDTEIYKTDNCRNEARNIKKLAIQYIKQFAEMKAAGKGLYFYGEAKGSGKTRLAASIGNALLTQLNVTVSFITTVSLLEEIKRTWDAGNPDEQTQSQLISAIKRVDVLILDDIGTERPTSWVSEMFYSILNDRMTARKVTFFTSNCRIEELNHDSRILSRIAKMAVPIKFPDESVRAVMARRENDELLNRLLDG